MESVDSGFKFWWLYLFSSWSHFLCQIPLSVFVIAFVSFFSSLYWPLLSSLHSLYEKCRNLFLVASLVTSSLLEVQYLTWYSLQLIEIYSDQAILNIFTDWVESIPILTVPTSWLLYFIFSSMIWCVRHWFIDSLFLFLWRMLEADCCNDYAPSLSVRLYVMFPIWCWH